MSYSIKISGAAKTARMFRRLQEKADRMMPVVAEAINRRHAAVFRRTWIPIDTGRLQASFRYEYGPDRELIIQRKRLSINSIVPYGVFHWHRFRPPLSYGDYMFMITIPIAEEIKKTLEEEP